jgi:dipeptidase D
MDIVKGFEPAAFWKHFYNITRIPHESGNEEGVRNYAREIAEKYGHDYKVDEIGNIVIKRKAAAGFEDKPSVVIQGHMDMVCEKNRDTVHDFDRDPIPLLVEDGWLKADGTTLGADNGVAVAAGLALLEADLELPVAVRPLLHFNRNVTVGILSARTSHIDYPVLFRVKVDKYSRINH